ncbi:hypothetical protein [Kitasatospora sp. NPDC008115]|uniref:hypothetical protein n=1 Tax=Kitasatospora sp. NPDC008115 TaxID=3364022 RepID=UPI0036EDF55C
MHGGFAALLLGASDYDLVGFTPLPFVPRDLERLGEALLARDFRVVLPPARGQVGANFVNGEVGHFLRTARRGETVLICLSGHGLHAEGKDYLIPEDLHSGVEPPWSGCVAIDWRYEVERTPAAQVLFLIDACRNGVRQDFMSGTIGWGTREALVVAGRSVAHLYACSPGEYARFVGSDDLQQDAGGGSFSLFSRAVLDVLLAHDGPLNLEQLRVGTQSRIQEYHERYGKQGRPQHVRVLTDVDQTAFLVAGPARRTVAPPAGGAGGSAPVLQPLAADLAADPASTDPGELLGRAVHELQTTGRTGFLEECAAVGPPADLLWLCSLPLAPAAAAAMWTAAGLRRPVASLMELLAALCGGGRTAAAHRVLESAATGRPADELLRALGALGLPPETADALRGTVLGALGGLPPAELAACVVTLKRADLGAEAKSVLATPRTVEGLLPLLAALDAAELAAEARELLREAVTGYGAQAVDGLVEALGRAGRAEHRTTVLTLLAMGPSDGIVAWLATGRSRAGLTGDAAFAEDTAFTPDAASTPDAAFAEDAAFVLRTAVAAGDRHALPPALRAAGLANHRDTVHEEIGRLPTADVCVALKRLTDAGATEDAEAVAARAVRPFRPQRAAELVLLLDRDGPAALLAPVCRELSEQPPAQVVALVGHLGNAGGLAKTVMSSLGPLYPLDAAVPLIKALRERGLTGAAGRFRRALVRERRAADLLPVLAGAGEQDRSAFLKDLLGDSRPPDQLAELLHLACGEDLRGTVGHWMASKVVDGADDEVLVAVLAELRAHGREAAEEELIDELGFGLGADRPERVAQLLVAKGLHDPAARLLLRVADRRGPTGVAMLGASVLAYLQPELGRRLLVEATQDRPVAFLAELAVALTQHPGGPGPLAERAEILRRVVEGRSPADVAELLVILDVQQPDARSPIDVTALLGLFLSARPVDEIGALLRELDARHTPHGAGGRLAAAVRDFAPALFHAARETSEEAGTRYVLEAFRVPTPMRTGEVALLLRELEGRGCHEEILAVFEQLGRFQKPPAVSELLVVFRDTVLFEVVCGAVANRPLLEIAAILVESDGLGPAGRRVAEYLGRSAPSDLCRDVLVALLVRRQRGAAGMLLEAVPWSRSTEELVTLLAVLERESEDRRRAALDTLTLDLLSADRAMELLHHLHDQGLPEGAVPVLRALAHSPDACGPWLEMHALGWFRYAAVLLDQLPRETDVLPWYRRLPGPLPEPQRKALLRETGADGPPRALAAGAATARAALGAAALHRSPGAVAKLLIALAGEPGGWTEPGRILAAARPGPELLLILAALGRMGHPDEAARIIDRVVADEPVTRVAELLDAGEGAAALIAESVVTRDTTADLIDSLVRVGHRGSAEVLIDAVLASRLSGSRIAEVVARLARTGAQPAVRVRLTNGFCGRQRAAEVAAFLAYLDRNGPRPDLEQALAAVRAFRDRELGEIRQALKDSGYGNRRLLTALAEQPSPPPTGRRFWRKDTNGP